MRAKSNLSKQLKLIWVVQSVQKKYSTLPVGQIISTSPRRPALTRGAYASSRTLSAGCDGRDSNAGRAGLMRTAKSCGPDPPTPGSSRRKTIRRRRWQKSPVTGEITKETVKTTRAGNAGCFRCDRGDYTRMLILFCMRGCGRYPRARHSLRPLHGGSCEPKSGREFASRKL
jgi:hypothetical protein